MCWKREKACLSFCSHNYDQSCRDIGWHCSRPESVHGISGKFWRMPGRIGVLWDIVMGLSIRYEFDRVV